MAGNLTAMIASIFSGSAVTADPYYRYTTLLLPGNGTNGAQNNTFLDGSTNNFTITRNGNTTQGTFSPFSQTGWGNYFSANTSELSFASNAAFNLSGVSWTIEFWAYPTENAPARDRNWITRRQASGAFTSSYQIYCGSGANTLKFLVTGQTVVTSTSSLTPNQWNHVAVVWNGTTLYFYINGVQDATTGTYGAGTGADAEPLRIGRLATNDNVLSYMSNVRVVKGVAVYTGNFTVPSTPLAITQSSGTNISAITGTQTSLLTCQTNRFVDVTANAFVPTVGTGTSVQAFSPFNPTASWSAATYGGSGYFDGSGDYLSLSTPVVAATGDFTIEGWFYLTNAIGTRQEIIYQSSPTDGSAEGRLAIAITNTGYLSTFVGGTNAPGAILSSEVIKPNTWYHFAYTRNSNTFTQYLNGVSQATPLSGTISINQNSLRIGYNPIQATYWFGYLSNIRIVNGTAVYTSNFTPPTAPLTAITNTALLLNFTNAGIYDATSKNDLETVGNAQISTTQSKWGSGSMSFDGTGDYLRSPASPLFDFNTGDFTVEAWVYTSSAVAYATVIDKSIGSGGTTGWFLEWSSTRGIWFFYQGSSASAAYTVATGQWYHLAVSKSGSSLRLFVNGVQQGSTATVTADITSTYGVSVGASNGTPQYQLNGYIQDLRITKGYARYTANFTPPTAAFPTL